ncbi:MAG: hypothetical protein H0X24_15140, partial [Ktedonobacterales bacterium]|nr:hypothetical protein [Ktedonobacterales bacterium]
MRHRPLRVCALLLLAVVAAWPGAMAHANRLAAIAGHVTVIVLDMSGSMAGNDPLGLRCSAANAYIDLSGSNPNDSVTNYVGIVGLANDNASGTSGGAHGFRLAQVWADPTATNDPANRNQLRQTIAAKSKNCAPNGNTPTYDSLAKAYGMLDSFLGAHSDLTGSVILLTDGNPDPQGDTQVADVNKEIVPKFVSKQWPVDSIALGTDTSYRGFLSGISQRTKGTAYDDSQGPVKGVSPLNLARVFADIFREYEGRALKPSIPPTAVAGKSSKQFFIGDAVTHLDVVAVKDTPGTTISLTDPNGQVFQPDQQGNFISTDPHYYIFSLEAHSPAPFLQNGPWTLNVSGSGQFLVDSLTVSTLALNITAPQDGATLPLGQPITLSATVAENGNVVLDKTYDVEALLTPPSGQPLRVFLKDKDATGTYSGTFTLPLSASAGAYKVDVTATQGTISAGEQAIGVKFAVFPTPVLLGANGQPLVPTTPTGCKPTDATTNCTLASPMATANVTAWDGLLRFIYTKVPLFTASWLRGWPLAGYALDPSATLSGEVIVGAGKTTQLYPGATVTATATRANGTAVPVTVDNLPGGHFRLHFPQGTQGTVNVQLSATGNPQDAFGNPVVVSGPVAVRLGGVPRDAAQRAWLITAFYLALMALIALFGVYGPINYALRAKPSRRNRLLDMSVPQGGTVDPAKPLVWRGASLRRYFAPQTLPAGQVGLPNTLTFRHSYGGLALRVRPTRGKTPAAA